MSKIEKELQEVLGAKGKQGEKESREKYLARLVRDTQELPDEKWEGLSSKTQDWVNAGVDAIKAKEPVAEFDGAAAKEEKADKKEKPAKEKKGAAKEKPAKPEKAPKEKKEKEKKEKAPKEKKDRGDRGKTLLFRKLQVQHPKWGVKELMDAMKSKGHEVAIGTAKQTYQGTRQTLDALRELGKLPKEKEEAKA